MALWALCQVLGVANLIKEVKSAGTIIWFSRIMLRLGVLDTLSSFDNF